MKTTMRERFNKHFVFKLVNTMEDRVWGTEDQRENLLSFFESELKGLREEIEEKSKWMGYEFHEDYQVGIDTALKLIDERMK